jgi:dUTPase
LIFSAIAVGNIIVIPRDINVVIPTLANLPIVPSSFPWLKTRIIIILAMGVEHKNYLYLISLVCNYEHPNFILASKERK